ncbi:MauE/DoxX family redox-associated membrane protein [Tahibacter sp.]|uniref:MauE/DoxX family redox-associated membrane protein n=1 Tax=Tahibacter sp. TaxID=2056211 RepID=UPI0031BB54A7
MTIASHLGEISRLWLLFAVLAAACGKSFAFGRFCRDLAASFPELGKAGVPVAASIVTVEWQLAALLLSGGTAARYGLIATALLFAAMTAVVALALAQDRTVVCRCFGTASHPMSGYDLLRNGLLVGAAVGGVLAPPLAGIDVYSHIALAGIALIAFQLSLGLQDIVAVLRIRV